MNEQRFYHTCGQSIWRIDDTSNPIYFAYEMEGELVRTTRCPRCQMEFVADSLNRTSSHVGPVEQTLLPSTSASLYGLADELVEAAEQLEGRADSMRAQAKHLDHQGNQIDQATEEEENKNTRP